jgi:predicted flap endonuclease-1-like 5' DNA nuclease
MNLERSTKQLIAVATLVAAILILVNQIVEDAPIENFWLGGLLLGISVFFWLWLWRESTAPVTALSVRDETRAPAVQQWDVSGGVARTREEGRPIPIAPDPEVREAVEETAAEMREEEAEPPSAPNLKVDERGAVVEETVEERDQAEVVEAAKQGDQMAEQLIAETEAAKPQSDTPQQAEANEQVTDAIAGEEVTREDQNIDKMPAAPDQQTPEDTVAEVVPMDQISDEPEPETAAESTSEDVETAAPVAEVEEADARVNPPEPTAPDEVDVIDVPPSGVETQAEDDLKRIEGVGPKYMDALVSAGLTSFEAVANASIDDLEHAVRGTALRRPGSLDTWSEQARYAARGDWEGLEAFQSTLVAGRRVDDEGDDEE